MKDPIKPDKRRTYDAAFRAEALRLAGQSRSTQAAARALNIDPKRICQWQKAAQMPSVATTPCGGSAKCSTCRPVAIPPGRRNSNGPWGLLR